MDVANQNAHYVVEPVETIPANPDVTDYEHDLSYDSGTPLNASNGANDFIWAGSFGQGDSSLGDGNGYSGVFDNSKVNTTGIGSIGLYQYNRGLYIHKDHPLLENVWEDAAAANNLDIDAVRKSMIFSMPKTATFATGATLFSFFGYNANLDRVASKQQTAYHNLSLIHI